MNHNIQRPNIQNKLARYTPGRMVVGCRLEVVEESMSMLVVVDCKMLLSMGVDCKVVVSTLEECMVVGSRDTPASKQV